MTALRSRDLRDGKPRPPARSPGNSAKAIELYQKALKSHTKSALVHNVWPVLRPPEASGRPTRWIKIELSRAIKYRNNLATVMVERGRPTSLQATGPGQ
jgi:hypothetical protein